MSKRKPLLIAASPEGCRVSIMVGIRRIAVLYHDDWLASDVTVGNAYDNAQHICRAVNAHDELVVALEEMVAAFQDEEMGTQKTTALSQARAALAKAKGTN